MVFDTDITQVFETLSYTSIFVWFLIYNFLFFVPIPPEIILVTVGYIASLGYINIFIVAMLIIVTSWTSSLILYFLTLRGSKVVQKIVQKPIGQRIFLKLQKRFEQKTLTTLIIFAFIPSVRFFRPIIAGSLKIRWEKFLIYSLLSISIFSAIFLFLGYFFHQGIAEVFGKLTILEHAIFYPTLIALTLVVIRTIRKHLISSKQVVNRG